MSVKYNSLSQLKQYFEKKYKSKIDDVLEDNKDGRIFFFFRDGNKITLFSFFIGIDLFYEEL